MLLFSVSLVFVAIMPTVYAASIWWGGSDSGFKRWQVFLLPAIYVVYVLLIVFWVQPFGTGAQGGSGPTTS